MEDLLRVLHRGSVIFRWIDILNNSIWNSHPLCVTFWFNLIQRVYIFNGEVFLLEMNPYYVKGLQWIFHRVYISQMESQFSHFRILRATSVLLGKGTKFALHHGKMSTTKRRAIQILHISTFMFTYKCGYNDFISKYIDINRLHVTQID